MSGLPQHSETQILLYSLLSRKSDYRRQVENGVLSNIYLTDYTVSRLTSLTLVIVLIPECVISTVTLTRRSSPYLHSLTCGGRAIVLGKAE
jgi:hypothetical protein